MASDVLIVTNGYKGTWSAIEQGAWLAGTLDSSITLLGVTEILNPAAIDDQHPLEEVFERAVGLFKEQGVAYKLEVQKGSAEDILPKRVAQDESVVVLSPLGRTQFRRMIAGRSIRHFIEELKQPILYVPESKLPVQRILICVGGLGYEVNAEHLAMQIGLKSRAEITLLHIVPPGDLDYPTARTIRDNWQRLEQTETPVGRSLRKALEIAKADGLIATVKGRQGNVVEEILTETRDGKYDLVCMGSSYSVHSLRQMYSTNVTSEIFDGVHCPVLTARYTKTP